MSKEVTATITQCVPAIYGETIGVKLSFQTPDTSLEHVFSLESGDELKNLMATTHCKWAYELKGKTVTLFVENNQITFTKKQGTDSVAV